MNYFQSKISTTYYLLLENRQYVPIEGNDTGFHQYQWHQLNWKVINLVKATSRAELRETFIILGIGGKKYMTVSEVFEVLENICLNSAKVK